MAAGRPAPSRSARCAELARRDRNICASGAPNGGGLGGRNRRRISQPCPPPRRGTGCAPRA
eukprot:180797-Lingulodinium_polyedra.AAC.1